MNPSYTHYYSGIKFHDTIKTSGSESRPRKVELANAHKKRDDYCEYFTHNNEASKNPYKTTLSIALIYSLVNGLFKISTEPLKLILDAEQSGASSNLIVPTHDVQKVSFFLSSSTHPH